MANPIHCDFEGCELLADWLVSRLDGTVNVAWCDAHYYVVAKAMIEQAEADEQPSDEPEIEPTSDLEAPVPDEIPEPHTDTQPQQLEPALNLDAVPETNPDDDEDDDEPKAAPEAPTPAVTKVVKRGTSGSRRRFQAKERAKIARQEQEA